LFSQAVPSSRAWQQLHGGKACVGKRGGEDARKGHCEQRFLNGRERDCNHAPKVPETSSAEGVSEGGGFTGKALDDLVPNASN